MSVQNKMAVITGASGGLGEAYARQLAASGYDLLISGRQKTRLEDLAVYITSTYGTVVEVLPTDLSDQSGISLLTKRVSALQRIDLLVSNAGYGERTMFADESVTDVMKMISVHINATVQLVHAVLPVMKRQHHGEIIAVSSLSAFVPAPGSSVYSATKTFLNTFMETIQMEVRQYGIHVQSLCPGLVHTNFHNGSVEKANMQTGIIDIWMHPDEVVAGSLNCLGSGRVVYIPGVINNIIKTLVGLLPRKGYYILTEKMTEKVRTVKKYPPCVGI